ncbi:MAG TPA: diguanylate cyclase [Desulfuromonadales bacterium]|nr:diguanylate cyclase [Desulfuromonadales bacterium]
MIHETNIIQSDESPDTEATHPEVHPLPRILLADDEPVSRSMLERHLTKEGYPFLSVCNGREALEAYQRESFQIVITDWLMPEMDGTALCRAIRSMSSDRYTFLFLLTSRNSPDAIVEGLEAGADDYIVKPLNPAELYVRLKGACRILNLEASLQRSLTEIRELSVRDPLTGAFNRGYLDHQLEHEIQRAYRYRHPLSLVMCDLDHFKKLNDTYGHQTGDEVLKRCVASISSSIRNKIDWVARYGGEEFLIALPETDAAGCSIVAERMRQQIASDPTDSPDTMIRITASFGAVTLDPASDCTRSTVADLIQRADICLYQAKQNGRDRVVAETLSPADGEF